MLAMSADPTGASATGWQPLRGLRVLDFSQLLPGPYATLALADLGADVIRVEAPQGDMARRFPMAMFRMSNRNKRAVSLDMKHPRAKELVARLASWADFAVEGFRPGVAAKLGIDHASLARINPRLIYCSLSGYGQTGPDRDAPGHELSYLAAAGSFYLPGHWGEPAKRLGIPIIDLAGGVFAALAMLAALHERQTTGKGAYLDLSLHETALALSTVRSGLEVETEFRNHLWPTNDLFETADGQVLVFSIVEDHFWRNFVAAVGDLAPDLAASEYDSDPGRRAHGDALHARMHEVLKMLSADQWMQRFAGRDVPVQPLQNLAEAGRSPQVAARATVMERDGEKHVPFPIHVDGQRGAALRTLAPEIGAHNREVMKEIGFGEVEIAEYLAAGVCGAKAAEAS